MPCWICPTHAMSKALSRISRERGMIVPRMVIGLSTGQPRRRILPSKLPRIVAMNERRINLHLVSEATGETLNTLARATIAQFDNTQIIMHRWSLIRTSFQLHRVLDGIEQEPGPVLSTLVDQA